MLELVDRVILSFIDENHEGSTPFSDTMYYYTLLFINGQLLYNLTIMWTQTFSTILIEGSPPDFLYGKKVNYIARGAKELA